ncbi:hypothetical protein NE237_013369 [Protea cynaroides]|uniref:Uncharacterized protein n=1 Tax=Protea cynaroides TaxID=273540 RepID=A0A9Q0GYL5_9MAGN|nr:hypothetical protein NE237_013369 [Protea cynaroides]
MCILKGEGDVERDSNLEKRETNFTGWEPGQTVKGFPPFTIYPLLGPKPYFSPPCSLQSIGFGADFSAKVINPESTSKMSSYNNNFESLLLQTLMGRLQVQTPYPCTNSYLSQSLEDILLGSSAIHEDDNIDRTPLAKEESKLEKEIVHIILGGNTETLKPNSGHAVTIGEHHVCIGFHIEKGSNYCIWEWHGHIILFDDENGYSPEYIYGNYFERIAGKPTRLAEKDEEEKEERGGNLGLRELIGGGDSISGRVLHRSMNSGSQSVVKQGSESNKMQQD